MKTVDEIYLAIAENIADVIQEEWKLAVLQLEVVEGMVSDTGVYVNNDDETKQIDVDEFDFELTSDILELHQIITANGSNRWNRLIFNLNSAGEFNVEFIWDQELQDEMESLKND